MQLLKKTVGRFIVWSFLFVGISCREEPTYELSLFLRNDTGSTITVELIPQSTYRYYDMYRFSDFESGYNLAVFDIGPGMEEHLFSTKQIDIKPEALALKVFQSINITVSDQNNSRLEFAPEMVVGYSENLFDSETLWSYEKRDASRPTNFRQNPGIAHTYVFSIAEGKILK